MLTFSLRGLSCILFFSPMKLCFFLVYVLMHLPLRDVHVLSDPIHFSRTQYFSKSSNNSSRGANLTPYSGVIFWGVILTPKRTLF